MLAIGTLQAGGRPNGDIAVATGCTKVAEPTPERTEFIDVATLALAEFRTRVLRTGEMTDTAAAYLALDHLRFL
ncbi:hypothetical protein [Kitasatospora sp. NPDC091276]|uniref:hypothetical protein n=1 Tax=Kitasatospora sp. NPDC091276 TaxID=3155300 RepID=UPI003437FE8C